MTAGKVLVRRAGKLGAKPILLPERVARALVAQGRLEYAEPAEQQAAMDSRRKKVITRAPRPRPAPRRTKAVGVMTTADLPERSAPEPEEPPPPPSEPEPEPPAEGGEDGDGNGEEQEGEPERDD